MHSPLADVRDLVNRFKHLEALRGELIARVEMLRSIMSKIQSVSLGDMRSTNGAGRGRRRGRPAGSARMAGRRSTARGRRGARRGKRGALRAAIHKVLAGGKVMKPAQIVKALPGAGFRSASSPRVAYTSTYLALRKDPAIKKTSSGFKLKARKPA